jgi:hypothetical protein
VWRPVSSSWRVAAHSFSGQIPERNRADRNAPLNIALGADASSRLVRSIRLLRAAHVVAFTELAVLVPANVAGVAIRLINSRADDFFAACWSLPSQISLNEGVEALAPQCICKVGADL